MIIARIVDGSPILKRTNHIPCLCIKCKKPTHIARAGFFFRLCYRISLVLRSRSDVDYIVLCEDCLKNSLHILWSH